MKALYSFVGFVVLFIGIALGKASAVVPTPKVVEKLVPCFSQGWFCFGILLGIGAGILGYWAWTQIPSEWK